MTKEEMVQSYRALADEIGINFIDGEPGRCFRNALLFLDKHPDWFLAHGIGLSTDGTNRMIVHAWIEIPVLYQGKKQWVVHCPSQSAKSPFYRGAMPRDLYYKSGKTHYVKRYTLKEANRLGDLSGTCGPWDKKLLEHFNNE